MAIASFAPSGGAQLVAGPLSGRILLPTAGSPTIALVTNLGQAPVFVALGDNTVVAAIGTGVAIPPNGQIWLTIGSATYLAAIGLGGAAAVSISVGA